MLYSNDDLSTETLWNISNDAKQDQTPCTASSRTDPPNTSAPLPQGDALVASESLKSLKKESKCDETVLEDALMPEMSVDG